MDKTLAYNIIATVTYYDVMDRALTSWEVWRWMIRAPYDRGNRTWTVCEVMAGLETPAVSAYVARHNGFYMLHGRECLVAMRRDRERVSIRKMRRLRRIVRLLQWSPYVRMIAVTGRLALKHAEKSSDLDVLVAYEASHIWTGRFFLTVAAHLLGVRRHGTRTSDRLCLNYHVTTASLAVPTQDVFSAHEYSVALPLAGAKVFDAFHRANASWIAQYKPHCLRTHFADENARIGWPARLMRRVQATLEWVVGDAGMERRLRQLQRHRALADADKPGACIVASDAHLVFLPRPHGPEVFEEYRKRFDALEIALPDDARS